MKSRLFLLLFLLIPPEAHGGNASSSESVFTPKPGAVSWKNVAYAIEGFIAFSGNLLICIAVFANKELRRKELIIVAGLAMSEFILGFAFMTAGIRRGWLEATGYMKQPSTPWHCTWVIHNPFFGASSLFQPLMMLMMSVDRLLAVKAPLWYWKQRNKYAYNCLYVIGAISLSFLGMRIIGSYYKPTNSDVILACNGAMALPHWMSILSQVMMALGGWGSVLIYVLVVYFYREQGKTLPNEQLIEEHMQRQRKMTKTIGICVIITLSTVCIGRTVKSILTSMKGSLIDKQSFYTYGPMMDCFININMMANVFVYSYRQKEIRAAIVRILTFGRVKLSAAKVHKLQRNIRVAHQKPEANEV